MIGLVYWSFVIGLTPVALSLAWDLISQVGRAIGLRLDRPGTDRLKGEASTWNARMIAVRNP
jgi:hypothetical protein